MEHPDLSNGSMLERLRHIAESDEIQHTIIFGPINAGKKPTIEFFLKTLIEANI